MRLCFIIARCHNTQVLHPDLLNKNFTQAEYAVRGELYLKGEELRKQGREVIFTNGVWLFASKSSAFHWVVKVFQGIV